MATSVTESLAAQGLDASDLETNRGGRVSERQIALQAAVRRRGALGVWLMATLGLVGCVVAGVVGGAQNGDPNLPIFMTVLGLVMAALPLGVYYGFRFPDPAKVATCAVTRLDGAEVGAFLPAPFRGSYAISLNGKRYSGFATLLSRVHLGARVNAFVIEEHRLVVALEPAD